MPSTSSTGATVKDVQAQEFIVALAAHYEKTGKLELPEWHDLIKTGAYKELCPQDANWYYVRAASMSRKIYLNGGLGVGAFAKYYGGSKSGGSAPSHFSKAATGLHRHILQQLSKANIVGKRNERKGRFITKAGQKELDVVAAQIVAKKKAKATA